MGEEGDLERTRSTTATAMTILDTFTNTVRTTMSDEATSPGNSPRLKGGVMVLGPLLLLHISMAAVVQAQMQQMQHLPQMQPMMLPQQLH